MRPIVARDLMNPEPLTVFDSMTLGDLATFLTDNEISGAPVVDRDGSLVGVVSTVDIARADSDRAEQSTWSSHPLNSWEDDWDRRALGDGVRIFHLEPEETRVRDLMNTSIHAVDPGTSVAEIARKMLHYHVHRLLVLDGGRLVGVISSSDLLGLLLDSE